jgi:septum formation protein
MRLILASSSPRRRELLRLITADFSVLPADADESLPPGTPAAQAAQILARRKAQAVAQKHPHDAVLGADTVVALGDAILGKPSDIPDAMRMLRLLAGKTHLVHTGVCLLQPGEARQFVSSAAVTFAPMSEREISFYAACKEPADKAGAYAVQGVGARYIERIEGDYYAVMGLPVCRLYRLLSQGGLLCAE